ncbi:MAG TPA: PorV/PorQ family protein [Longimicrobiales bacterium]|nr:PorV/PorQ family protein [Longimicrobiales bacterium]
MRFIRNCTLAAMLMAIGAGGLQAQSGATPDDDGTQVTKRNTGAGTTAAEFLLLGAGAKGMALGPAYSAMTRDVESLFYNPAALSLMPGAEVAMTVMPYFADTRYLWAGAALPLAGGEYGIGLSVGNFGFNGAPVYTEDDQENASQQTYSVNQTVVGLSFAHSFIDRFSGGITLKLINDQLGSTSAFGAAVDVGTNYHAELAGRPISMAFVIQNLGTGLKHSGSGLDFNAFPETEDPSFPTQGLDPAPARFEAHEWQLPVVFRFGVAYDVVSAATNRVTLCGYFNEHYNNAPSFGLSGEFAWTPADVPVSAALRGSYAYQPDNDLSSQEEVDFASSTSVDNEGLDGLAIGGGLNFNLSDYAVKADYAWRHFGVLGSRNVFSVGIGWR